MYLTCKNCFVCLEFPTAYCECDITKFLVLEELSEIVGQPTFRHLELYRVTLSGNIDTIRDYADLRANATRGSVVRNQCLSGTVRSNISGSTINIQTYIPHRISWVCRPGVVRWPRPEESLSWWISWSPNLYPERTYKRAGSLKEKEEDGFEYISSRSCALWRLACVQ